MKAFEGACIPRLSQGYHPKAIIPRLSSQGYHPKAIPRLSSQGCPKAIPRLSQGYPKGACTQEAHCRYTRALALCAAPCTAEQVHASVCWVDRAKSANAAEGWTSQLPRAGPCAL
eukprot:1179749-Prorocentrum_minimum.AAC.3